MTTEPRFKENSQAVQSHLTILQAVIQRMANNSSSSKAWCITLVSAILVIVADKGKPQYAWIAVIRRCSSLFLMPTTCHWRRAFGMHTTALLTNYTVKYCLPPIFLLLFHKAECSASLPDRFSHFQFGRFTQRFSE